MDWAGDRAILGQLWKDRQYRLVDIEYQSRKTLLLLNIPAGTRRM
jgi:hypothetical protein